MALDPLGLDRGLVGEVGRLLSDQAQLGQGDFANASTAVWGGIKGKAWQWVLVPFSRVLVPPWPEGGGKRGCL